MAAENREPGPPLVMSSSYTLRAPVHEECRRGAGSRVYVLDGHNHQVVLEARSSTVSRAKRRTRQNFSSDKGSSSGSMPGGSTGDAGEDANADGEGEEGEVTTHIHARHATKLAVGPVIAVRLMMTYSAAVVLGFWVIFSLNMLMKYAMVVLIPLGQQGSVVMAVLSLSCLPVLCLFLSHLVSVASGVMIDIWHDLNWLECSATYLPMVARQWFVLSLIVLAPLTAFIIGSFVNPSSAYTVALFTSFGSVQLLFLSYFGSVMVARVRLCMILMNTGKGPLDTFLRVVWIGMQRRHSIILPIAMVHWIFKPKASGTTAPGPLPHASGANVELGEVSCPSPGQEAIRPGEPNGNGASCTCKTALDPLNAAISSRTSSGNRLEFSTTSFQIKEKAEVEPTCLFGGFSLEEQWAPTALDKEVDGILTEYHFRRILTSCCMIPESNVGRTYHPSPCLADVKAWQMPCLEALHRPAGVAATASAAACVCAWADRCVTRRMTGRTRRVQESAREE
mmetsp:Transcript_35292/g.99910  ORF Transcript_35292/g.99910 Transcript_35292/m.99910 type:complete len:508 (-) Transcript_35292:1802-3325(-)